jgi:hypothetical protein
LFGEKIRTNFAIGLIRIKDKTNFDNFEFLNPGMFGAKNTDGKYLPNS